ncbi:hypothetical protein [uncultured Clostridium sp.]|uniref:hypothetical protein n=1 Tax=uncultured Clostridium sp. TaxID=59620 RepID=UPI002632F1F1|nr:hypothetical protein [uncultured Clostridium sp.]
MFHISPNAVVSIGFNVIEPYIRENFEYVMIEGKEEPVHELMGLEYFGTRNVKHISKITRDNRIENLIGPNGETHTVAEYGRSRDKALNRKKKRSTKKKVIIVIMLDGEEFEYNSMQEIVRELGVTSWSVKSVLKHKHRHEDGWIARYEERER